MTQLFRLDDRVAWVVGGAGHLGLPVCRGLAMHGARVIIADKSSQAADRAAAQLRSEGLAAEPMHLDITDEQAIGKCSEQILAEHRRLDILVNLTTYSSGKPMETMTGDEWDAGVRVTLKGAFLLSRHVGGLMAERRSGSIIQFSSMYGMVSPDPSVYGSEHAINPIDYGTAKAAILQMVRYQAVMWGPRGVRVNAVVPGPFPNPAGHGSDERLVQRLSQKVPLGRVGKAEEIVGAVVFLAADASSYVTGQHLIVDGGWTAW